jgi:H/ACA ribonucleoprotein complex subunit 3
LKSLIRYCRDCEEYTLDEICGKCRNKTVSAAPPRFSPEDRYGKYRRLLKKQISKKIRR